MDDIPPIRIVPTQPPQPPAMKTYSVPRRFGIGTIFGVATAFAVLIWGLQLLRTPPPVIIAISVFLAIVGGVQAIFQKTPRWSSMAAGELCALGLAAFTFFQDMDPEEIICIGLFYVVFGPFVGYCGGALVAGLFLVMDWFTGIFAKRIGGETNSPHDVRSQGE